MIMMKTLLTRFFYLTSATLFLLLSNPAIAGYALDSQASRVSFLSTKNAAVTEVHHFETLAGALTDSGQVTVIIDLASVETNIGIRNKRMKEHLFDVDNFPTAIVSGQVDLSSLENLAIGGSKIVESDAMVNLHGKTQSVALKLLVTRAGARELLAVSLQPVVIQASAFDLVPGLNKLQEIAKLKSITTAVPVNVVLKFSK